MNDLYAAALDFVNSVRDELGEPQLLRLLPGAQKKAASCPISNSIAYGLSGPIGVVTYDTATVVDYTDDDVIGKNVLYREVPQDAFNFVRQFDAGHYPELVR